MSFKLNTKEFMRDFKRHAEKEIKENTKKKYLRDGATADIDCPKCNKEIKEARIKDNEKYQCPFCEEEFNVTFDFSNF